MTSAAAPGWRQQTTARTANKIPTEDRDRLRRVPWPDTERNDGVGSHCPRAFAICCQRARKYGSLSEGIGGRRKRSWTAGG
ncbi:hypothetical protein M431DRAFT_510142 [Trichoderma harzianum CBS 226.95]|uniref:Uncharacterized protein n=1 Tax=Trichoderma harzianum CBS 226.95 TaxID=983964 RepID=A0A2T4A724_TRIHA|nr:hypothetical protein M431DRAFT_510142 [Trichoderma harzianum CBS 226.95]PTB52879.1 hypothetical protein M431DRAFT_510142 [Trichoderma harzianum CBS 226.95]